jgi:hypothetical protein
MTLTLRLDPLIAPLQVPPDFSRYEKLVETDIVASLEQWKLKTDTCLAELRDLVARESTQFSVQDHALVVSAIASFEGEGSWITSVSREISKGEWIVISCMTDRPHLAKLAEILALYYGEPSATLLDTILTHHVKPIFKFNPHPSLNLSTGRKLPATAGGPMGMQDYYEGQVWKRHPGAPNLVSWCVRNIQVRQYCPTDLVRESLR